MIPAWLLACGGPSTTTPPPTDDTSTATPQPTGTGSTGSGTTSDTSVHEPDEACPTLMRLVQVGSSLPDDVARIALHPDGDVVVAGSFGHTIQLGEGPGGTISGCGPQDAFVAKLSPDLLNVRWSHVIGGCGDDEGRAVAVGEDGTVVLVGRTGWDLVALDGVELLPRKDGLETYGGFVAVFEADGTFRWLHTVGANVDWFGAVAVGPMGEVAAAGGFHSDSISSGPFTVERSWGPANTSPRDDGMATAWDRDGVPLWLLAFGGEPPDKAPAIAWLDSTPVVVAQVEYTQPATWRTAFANGDFESTDATSYLMTPDRKGSPTTIVPVATTRTTIEEVEPFGLDLLLLGSAAVPLTIDLPDGTTVSLENEYVFPRTFMGAWVRHDAAGPRSAAWIGDKPPPSGPYIDGGTRGIGGHVGRSRMVATGTFGGEILFGEETPREIRVDMEQTSGADGFAATYRLDGEFRCVWTFDYPSLGAAKDAVALDDGSVIVVGDFLDAMTVYGGDGVSQASAISRGGYDGFIARFVPSPP